MKWIGLLGLTAALLAACGGSAGSTAPASSAAASPASAAAAPASARPAAPASSAAAASSFAASGKPAAGAAAGTKLNVAFSTLIPHYLPVWYSQDAGVYAANGLNVDQKMLNSTLGVAALLSGDVSIYVGGASELLNATATGADGLYLANLAPVSGFKLMVNSSIRSKDDLVGKKMGITRAGSNTDTILRTILTRAGLNPDKDVSYLQLGGTPEIIAGLQAGSIQGAVFTPPDNIRIENMGFRALYDTADLHIPDSGTVVTVTRAWLNANHATAQHFIDSMVQSTARIKQDKPGAEASLKKQLKLDDEQLLSATYDYFTKTVWPVEPLSQPEQFAAALAVVQQAGKLPGFDVSKLIDNSLVQDAVSRGLTKG
jgi:ABC-type nitrate/sulfonate/bicarbonate transport system substrate-binding protein